MEVRDCQRKSGEERLKVGCKDQKQQEVRKWGRQGRPPGWWMGGRDTEQKKVWNGRHLVEVREFLFPGC